MRYTCIYCKTEKDENEFNREHVVPQMMGRYTDGLVLNAHQVCKECNSFFSREIENKIGLDSYSVKTPTPYPALMRVSIAWSFSVELAEFGAI